MQKSHRPETMAGTPEQALCARAAWLGAMATLEAYRLEANRLWLEYLALADPGTARKIRRILKHAEQGATKAADELFPAALSPEQSIPQEPGHLP
jgi:hypothetical protein